MKLSQLFSIFNELNWGLSADLSVNDVTQDSRKVTSGSVFVAVSGTNSDGHKFVGKAVESGAIALVVQNEASIPDDYEGAKVVVEDSRKVLGKLCSRFYGEPTKNMFCAGVTGTNGKTSVSYMVEHLLNGFSWSTGVLGTVDHHLGEKAWESELTTPGPEILQKRLSEFRNLGAQACVFEVSSHALDQGRADDIPFDVSVFTNLTRDHLDYHKDFESYFQAKQKLFNQVPMNSDRPHTAVVNIDDEYGRKVETLSSSRKLTFGQDESDFQFRVIDSSLKGIEFSLATAQGEQNFYLPVVGLHNVYNAVAAIATAVSAGFSLAGCAEHLKTFAGVPGRLEKVPAERGPFVFVDYAHTDDALKSVLSGLNEVRNKAHKNSKIITVFGCGGDRDKGKRPLMLAAAQSFSDKVIVTSDNPRTEDPEAIINDILAGSDESQSHREVDRKKAIQFAIKKAGAEDIVLIAGKGHEDYQIIGTEKKPFSDKLIAKEILSGI